MTFNLVWSKFAGNPKVASVSTYITGLLFACSSTEGLRSGVTEIRVNFSYCTGFSFLFNLSNVSFALALICESSYSFIWASPTKSIVAKVLTVLWILESAKALTLLFKCTFYQFLGPQSLLECSGLALGLSFCRNAIFFSCLISLFNP